MDPVEKLFKLLEYFELQNIQNVTAKNLPLILISSNKTTVERMKNFTDLPLVFLVKNGTQLDQDWINQYVSGIRPTIKQLLDQQGTAHDESNPLK